MWDSQWYGGHWTFNYSVLFPPIGWLAGIPVMETVCVALAAWAFDRLAVARFGRAGRVGAIVFAVGTVAQVANGQEPYLLGETIGLLAVLAASGKRWPLALPLGAAAALASPLTGAFVAIVAAAWLIGSWPARRWRPRHCAAAAAPVLAIEAAVPGPRPEPFEPLNFVGMLAALVPIGIVVARRDRTIAVGVALYALAARLRVRATERNRQQHHTARCLLRRRTGGHACGRAAAWPGALDRRRDSAGAGAMDSGPPGAPREGNSSMSKAYFQPLLRYLNHADRPLGRVEVVPTVTHWEAGYVAPFFPLARGWERQLETANDAIFYRPGRLSVAAYRAWLFANGVRFIALPDVALDYSAAAEAQSVRSGVPGIDLVWHSAHWRVYRVAGDPGIVSGPARLLSSTAAQIDVLVTGPAPVVIRERYVPAWRVRRGRATLTVAKGGWLELPPDGARLRHAADRALGRPPTAAGACVTCPTHRYRPARAACGCHVGARRR